MLSSPCLVQGADTKEECLRVEDKILLKSSAEWASCPDILLLPFNGRNFEVKVRRAQRDRSLFCWISVSGAL